MNSKGSRSQSRSKSKNRSSSRKINALLHAALKSGAVSHNNARRTFKSAGVVADCSVARDFTRLAMSEGKMTPLMRAIVKKDMPSLERLGKCIVDEKQDYRDKYIKEVINYAHNGATALYMACDVYSDEKFATAVAIYLLDHGANPNGTEKAPLSRAIENGYTGLARILIAAGADINAIEKSGTTALFSAASVGNLELVKDLVELGADINLGKSVIFSVQSRIGRRPFYGRKPVPNQAEILKVLTAEA